MKRLQELIRLDFLLTNKFKSNFTFFMSLIAIALFVNNPSREQEICMYAILFSTIADLVLMNYNDVPELIFRKNRFYAGMALFCITHTLYIYCFLSIIPLKSLFIKDIIVSLMVYYLISMFSMGASMCMSHKKSNIFKVAVSIYVILINFALLAIFICAELFGGRYILKAMGIIFFLISDMCILIRETIYDTNLVRKLIWIFYPFGQLLIICSV